MVRIISVHYIFSLYAYSPILNQYAYMKLLLFHTLDPDIQAT